MDCDFSHDPKYIPLFLSAAAEADLVIGPRYASRVNVVNWHFKRLILSWFASQCVRAITGMPCSDLTGGFKCWRRKALEALSLERVFSVGYVFMVETTYRAWKKGHRVKEVPVIFYERNLGRSTIDPWIILEAFVEVIRLRFTRIGD
jgi:dolichol-phosphate mannosyltransferase